jgi:hypothetical protein
MCPTKVSWLSLSEVKLTLGYSPFDQTLGCLLPPVPVGHEAGNKAEPIRIASISGLVTINPFVSCATYRVWEGWESCGWSVLRLCRKTGSVNETLI